MTFLPLQDPAGAVSVRNRGLGGTPPPFFSMFLSSPTPQNYVSFSNRQDMLLELYEVTLHALERANNDRLWFNTTIQLGKLYFEAHDFGKLQRVPMRLPPHCCCSCACSCSLALALALLLLFLLYCSLL